tara:strand:- start:82 stop:477 length:396 start_codon:yes stop_codon:yes gene_type:complete
MAECGPGQKEIPDNQCRDVAYIDADGNAQIAKRDHWIVWTVQINCLEGVVEVALTSCYHAGDITVANTHETDDQMVHITMYNRVDVTTDVNYFQELIQKVNGNPFQLTPQIILDYLEESDQLPTRTEHHEE